MSRISTVQPSKSRVSQRTAAYHNKRASVKCRLVKALRDKMGKSSIKPKVGDSVNIVAGDKKGEEAEVVKVNVADGTFHLSKHCVKTRRGERPIKISVSNCRVSSVSKIESRIK